MSSMTVKCSPQNSSDATSAATQAAGAPQQHKAAQENNTNLADLHCLQQQTSCFSKALCVVPKQVCKLLSNKGNLRGVRPLHGHIGWSETSAMRWT